MMIQQIFNKYIQSAIRGLIYALAGSLVTLGILSPEHQEAFTSLNTEVVVGLLIYILGQVWSFIDKRNNQKNTQSKDKP